MISAFPLIEELDCQDTKLLMGDVKSLRVVKDSLWRVCIEHCPGVCGDFMEFADYPLLKVLHLFTIMFGNRRQTSVEGDVRNISDVDFPMLRSLHLPDGVYGSVTRVFECVADAQECMKVLGRLYSRIGNIHSSGIWKLSVSSPDRYRVHPVKWYELYPPFKVKFVRAGPRLGWRWWNESNKGCCETNWIDPEPDRQSGSYVEYLRDLEKLEKDVYVYRGFFKPPTPEEWIQIFQVYKG